MTAQLHEDFFQVQIFDPHVGVPAVLQLLEQLRRDVGTAARALGPAISVRSEPGIEKSAGSSSSERTAQPFDAVLQFVEFGKISDLSLMQDGHVRGHPFQVRADVRRKQSMLREPRRSAPTAIAKIPAGQSGRELATGSSRISRSGLCPSARDQTPGFAIGRSKVLGPRIERHVPTPHQLVAPGVIPVRCRTKRCNRSRGGLSSRDKARRLAARSPTAP